MLHFYKAVFKPQKKCEAYSNPHQNHAQIVKNGNEINNLSTALLRQSGEKREPLLPQTSIQLTLINISQVDNSVNNHVIFATLIIITNYVT